MPPGSSAASASRPATSFNEARRFLLASVKIIVPVEKSSAAMPLRFGIALPTRSQCKRPEIIRWMTT